MCGRYASARSAEDLASWFQADQPEPALPPRWNVAPTDPVYAVVERDAARRLQVLRWGLVPSWSTHARAAARLINARVETVGTKPAFRAAYQRRRCLLPADGYYEWQVDGTGRQPFFLSARDGSPLAMAGLYEIWSPPAGDRLWTCTVITTSAADEHGDIHDRTPLLVARRDWARWLDPAVADPGADLLTPGLNGVLDAWPVSPAVGNVRNDGPELIEPVPVGRRPAEPVADPTLF